jgi:cardiolipin synthase
MGTGTMWDQSVETVLDQRQRAVPPVMVRQVEQNGSVGAPRPADWKVHPTGRDRIVHDEVLSLLRAATHVVVFSSFLLSDTDVQRELLAAASRGCRVYGLISAEAKLDRDLSDEDAFDAKTADAHKQMLDDFAGRMIIRSSPSFHAKCVLIDPGTDRARGLLLTANLTTEALTRNEELAVRLSATESRALFVQLRHAIWELAERELVGKGQVDRVKPLGEVPLPSVDPVIHTTMGGRCHIRDTMLTMIANARHAIIVSSYGWDADHPVVAALCERAASGVSVTALARYRSTSMGALLELRRAGAKVLCLPWLHAKALVCDEESLVMSANLQRHGMDDGVELGVRLGVSDTGSLLRVLKQWTASSPWRLETPAVLGDLSGDIVPLGPSSPPKSLDGTVTIKTSAVVSIDDVTAESADRLDQARLDEAALRRESEKRGLTWIHSIQFRYKVRAPRLPSNAKPEPPTKGEAGGKEKDSSSPRVFRLSDGSRVVGMMTRDDTQVARALAESRGIKRVLAMEAAQ